MIMKYKDFKTLSTGDMKQITGGIVWEVSCIAQPGYHIESPGSCTGSQSACQASADAWCANSANHCGTCSVA